MIGRPALRLLLTLLTLVVLFAGNSLLYATVSADDGTNAINQTELSLDQVCVLLQEKRARLKPLEEARRRQAGEWKIQRGGHTMESEPMRTFLHRHAKYMEVVSDELSEPEWKRTAWRAICREYGIPISDEHLGQLEWRRTTGLFSGVVQKVAGNPFVFSGIFSHRNPTLRDKMIAIEGFGAWTELGVVNALRWLKKTQAADGSWPETKPAMTALALLTFLGHGETDKSREFGITVDRAIQFLLQSQEGNGHFKGRDEKDYTHPIATYALCEAYAVTRLAQIKIPAQKAVQVLLDGQHVTGGFGYNLKRDGPDDTSYMSWCAQALVAADFARAMDDPAEVRKTKTVLVQAFKGNYQTNSNNGDPNEAGGFGYTTPGQTGLTGAGAFCMQFLGSGQEKEVVAALRAMTNWSFAWLGKSSGSDIYHAYYVTLAKFQAGGEEWRRWVKQVVPYLVKNQTILLKAIPDANGRMVDAGYWEQADRTNRDTGEGSRVMTTCLCTLMLETCYRYVPAYQSAPENKVE